MKNISIFLVLFMTIFVACKEYDVTKSGLQYKIHTESKGRKAKVGDFVKLHMITKNDNDSVIGDTYKMNGPVQIQLREPSFKGDMMEGLTMLSVGDSATFIMPTDSIFKGGAYPPGIDSNSYLQFDVKVIEVKSMEEFQKDFMKKQAEDMQNQQGQLAADIDTISAYLAERGIKAKKSQSGVFYVIKKEGSGSTITPGDTLSVHYKGMFMNGEVFDQSFDPDMKKDGELACPICKGSGSFQGQSCPRCNGTGKATPFKFTYMSPEGRMIPGWEEALPLFKKGTQATLYIPSPLAYGSASEDFPPNSILIFDIDILDVKKAKK